MKKRIIMMIMGVALMALPIMAQQQEWRSTSAMHTSGSAYTPQVNDVGATTVGEMATTTESNSQAKAPGGPRREEGDWGTNPHVGEGDEGSPIGDAVLPLMLCACTFLIYRASRRRKKAVKS